MLDLTQIELATDEDKAYNIDYCAKLFNAKTWEELNMLASEKDILKEASETVYTLTQEEKIRLQCQAREDYYRTQNDVRTYYTRQLEEKDAEIEALKQQKDTEIEALKKQIEDLKNK